jgi:hypothetical protein
VEENKVLFPRKNQTGTYGGSSENKKSIDPRSTFAGAGKRNFTGIDIGFLRIRHVFVKF